MKNLFGALSLVFGASVAFAGASKPEAVPGEFVVKLKPSVSTMAKTDLSKKLGMSVLRLVSPESHLALVKTAARATQKSVSASLMKSGMVEYVEPNYIYHATRVPNDTDFGKLWGMKNTGAADSIGQIGVAGIDVNVVNAWDLTTGSRDVVVGVIDTGIDYNLQDLANNIWTNEAEKNGVAGVDDDNNGYVDDIHGYDFANQDADPMDDYGHGTHCAGTIGAEGDNGFGVAGVAWKVRLMPIKFLSSSGSGTLADAVSAIDYATKMGVTLTSNSWGGGGFNQSLEDAITRAKDKGILFVAAAGNDSSNNDSSQSYPSGYALDNIVSVAAIDNKGQLATFSNYGKRNVDVGAPGVRILSLCSTVSDPGMECVNNMTTISGTSMATPHVAGIAALLKSYDSSLTYSQIRERIIKTAVPIAGLTGKVASGGIVNAYNALMDIRPPLDMNDPANWETFAFTASTPHPYPNNMNQTYQVTVPGARKIAVHFDKFDFETGYDKVEFIKPDGTSAGFMSGNQADSFGPVIDGDTVTLKVTSDSSVTKLGFDIVKIAIQR